MRKIVFFLGFLFLSCGGGKKIQEVTMEKDSHRYYEVPATRAGISKGTKKIEGPITKEELKGATVSFSGDFEISPEIDVQKEIGHDQYGAIIRRIRMIGNNTIEVFSHKKGGKIISVHYDKWSERYPSEIVVEIPGQNGNVMNLQFDLDPADGRYYPSLDKENVKFIEDDAGYRFTDPITKKHGYLNNSEIFLETLFIDQHIDDERGFEEGGVPLPQ